MFADIEADVYVLVDGDDTYDAAAAPAMVDMLLERPARHGQRHAGQPTRRRPTGPATASATRMLTGWCAGSSATASPTCCRATGCSPAASSNPSPRFAGGFETETEFTVHALELQHADRRVAERLSRSRRPASTSKLRTYRDGLRILRTIVVLVKQERPLQFFGIAGARCCCSASASALPVVLEYAAHAAWCRACRPACWRPGSCCCRSCRSSAA